NQEPPAWEENQAAGGPEPAAAEPDDTADSDASPSRGRRRGRGRGRRPRDEKARKEGTEAGPVQGATADPIPVEEPKSATPGEAAPPRDWPRLMESAEHRTTEGEKPRQ